MFISKFLFPLIGIVSSGLIPYYNLELIKNFKRLFSTRYIDYKNKPYLLEFNNKNKANFSGFNLYKQFFIDKNKFFPNNYLLGLNLVNQVKDIATTENKSKENEINTIISNHLVDNNLILKDNNNLILKRDNYLNLLNVNNKSILLPILAFIAYNFYKNYNNNKVNIDNDYINNVNLNSWNKFILSIKLDQYAVPGLFDAINAAFEGDFTKIKSERIYNIFDIDQKVVLQEYIQEYMSKNKRKF